MKEEIKRKHLTDVLGRGSTSPMGVMCVALFLCVFASVSLSLCIKTSLEPALFIKHQLLFF